MKKKESRLWVSKFNQQRMNALKAELNANNLNSEKLLIQNDAVDHLFIILQKYKKLKKEMYELKKNSRNEN